MLFNQVERTSVNCTSELLELLVLCVYVVQKKPLAHLADQPNTKYHTTQVYCRHVLFKSSLQSYLCKDRRLDTDCLQQHGTFPLYIWYAEPFRKTLWRNFDYCFQMPIIFFLFSSDALLNIATNIWITFGDYNGVKLVSKINNIPCTHR